MKTINYKGKELLPPKSDLVFKAIFGAEENKDILAAFLTDVLEIKIQDYHDIELINTELLKDYSNDKSSRLDIRVKTAGNEFVDIEIQLANEGNIIPRSIYYNCKLFTTQMSAGMEYKALGSAVSLIILDFVLFPKIKTWYNSFRLMNSETFEDLSDLLELSFLELPKLNGVLERHSKLSSREKWSLFLAAENGEVLDMLASENPAMKKAVKKLVYVSEDERMRYVLDMREKAERDHYCALKNAEEIGLGKGLKTGRVEGLEEGRAEGKRKEKMLIAKGMKAQKFPDELIAKITGLPMGDILTL